jgi:hypothetical protein
MQLTEEAKELVAKHVAELSRANEAMLRELNMYRWALRAFFVLLFGGSILGVLKLQDYLDDRIQKRSEELSGIIYGSAAQSSGDPSAAVEQYAAFLEKLENPVFRPSETIRSIYYTRFLEALADDSQVDANGDFLVQPAYIALLESKTYRRDLIVNQRKWNNDPIILNAMARCLVKFEPTKEKLHAAMALFGRAASIADRPSDRASNHFAMAMMHLAAGDVVSARRFIEQMGEISPRTHGIKLYGGTLKGDLENEYQMWDRAARINGQPGIAERYETVMTSLIMKSAKAAPR